jgi:prepilin-type processing-associated H-X9-DG protein
MALPTMGGMVLFGILAAAMGSLLALAVWAFGGGALLFVGGRYIVKSPKATYWRSVGTAVLAALASGIILALASALSFRLLGPFGFVGVLAGAAAGLLVTWLIIMAMFAVSFGKAILAWLPMLAMAIIALPIIGLLVAVLVPALTTAREQTNRTVCMSNLRSINRTIVLYRSENDGNWPADFQTMIAKYQDSPNLFTCPCVRGGSRPAGRTCDYFYFLPKSDADPQTIVACDYRGNHRDGSRNVFYADGSVRTVSAVAFQAELADPANAAFAAALLQVEPSAGGTRNGGD